MKFKVGDRVKVIKKIDEYEFVFGKSATVVHIDTNYEFPIELEFDEDSNIYLPELFKEDELEFIEKGVALKQEFVEKCKEVSVPKVLSVAVQLPSGAIEVITNTQDTVTKALYYTDTYDEEFRLKHNKEVRVVGFMVV
jgi:hypothetical protein